MIKGSAVDFPLLGNTKAAINAPLTIAAFTAMS